ncbi:MAG: alpha/beta fold hydrolase [Flavobacteriales bacterium]|nr:alpha/beta fold hydrolase [Flavobacteriales bacterium]
MTVYFLPGVGCDKRLFSRIQLQGVDVRYLEWPPFPEGCTLAELAAEMRAGVDVIEPHILAGVSMGGMVAQELALLTTPQKVILISTWTGPSEFPQHVRIGRALHLPNLIGSFTMWATWPFKRMLGERDRATDQLLWDMARQQTASKIKRGIQAVLRWQGSRWKGRLVRIHGTNDHVVPLGFPVDHAIVNGSHIMVLDRAAEVSRSLQAAIEA